MAEKIAKNIWRIDIPLVGNPLKNLNSYLVTADEAEASGSGRSLLIDTGFRQKPCMEAMERQLSEIGVDRNKLDIFLTHLHSDHTGLSTGLIRADGKIYMSAIDAAGVLDHRQAEHWERIYASYVENGFPEAEIELLHKTNSAETDGPLDWSSAPVERLEEGASLCCGGYKLRCVFTPGHTPGHMCLYENESKILFSGDHVLFHITPNICRWDVMPDALGSYLESLDKIRELEADLLLPAHRAETGALKERVDELKAHHERRLMATLEAVEGKPGATACELGGLVPWRIRSRSWEEFPPMQRFFAVGETLAHLDHLAFPTIAAVSLPFLPLV